MIHEVAEEVEAPADPPDECFFWVKLEFQFLHDLVGSSDHFAQGGLASDQDDPVVNKSTVKNTVHVADGSI